MLCLMAGQMSDYARAESGFWPPAQPLLSRHQFSHALRAIDDLKGLSLDLYLDDAEYVVARRPEEVYGQHCLVTDAKTVARLAAIVSNLRMAKIESGLSNYRLRIRFSRSGEAVFDAVFTYPGEHNPQWRASSTDVAQTLRRSRFNSSLSSRNKLWWLLKKLRHVAKSPGEVLCQR